jgi:Tfp pilus assembly protein PilF
MKQISPIKTTFSLVLALILAITMVLASPDVSFAKDTSNSALEALEKGIEFDKKGDLVNAEFFYNRAIDKVLANGEVPVLIGAKQRLAKIKENQGKIQEADKLYEEAEAGEKALGTKPPIGGGCGDCTVREKKGDLQGVRCVRCAGG